MAPPTGFSAPSLLVLPQLPKIVQANPDIGRALQDIVDYINKNVTPVQGNKLATKPEAPGGQVVG